MPKELTAEQNEWLDKTSGLAQSAVIDEKIATAKSEASADPRTAYTKARAALTGQLKKALPLDSDRKLACSLKEAETHFKNEKYAEALESIEAAGELATALISASKTYERKDGKTAPSQADQIGATTAPKSKELGAGVRNEDISSGVYYADSAEKRAQSEFNVDGEGRLIDAQGLCQPLLN